MQLYLISGKIKTGKDTCGKFLQEEYQKIGKTSCILPMSGPLREYAKNYFGWDGRDETKPRELLQQLGTEVIREKLHKDTFLINRAIEDIEILSLYFDVIIVTGIRRKEEIDSLKAKFPGAINIHMIRSLDYSDLSDVSKNHYTEHALDAYQNYDYCMKNLSLEELRSKIEQIVKERGSDNEKND